jgi:environmental stress-induced protein Ves
MGSEIYDVKVTIGTATDSVVLAYATKVSSKKNKDTSTTLTFDGDVNTSAKNTGGTISIERLAWPMDVEEAKLLETILEADLIKSVTCSGRAYTVNGDVYTKQIIGTNVTVTSDEDEWSPSDGVTQKLELAVNRLQRINE